MFIFCPYALSYDTWHRNFQLSLGSVTCYI